MLESFPMCRRVIRLLSWPARVMSFGFVLLSSASATDSLTIREILDEPASYHLKQVMLSGTVRNVQPPETIG